MKTDERDDVSPLHSMMWWPGCDPSHRTPAGSSAEDPDEGSR